MTSQGHYPYGHVGDKMPKETDPKPDDKENKDKENDKGKEGDKGESSSK